MTDARYPALMEITYRDTKANQLYETRCVQDVCTLRGERNNVIHHMYRELFDELISDGTLEEYTEAHV